MSINISKEITLCNKLEQCIFSKNIQSRTQIETRENQEHRWQQEKTLSKLHLSKIIWILTTFIEIKTFPS